MFLCRGGKQSFGVEDCIIVGSKGLRFLIISNNGFEFSFGLL